MPLQVPLFVDPNDVIGRMQLEPTLAGVTDVVSSAIMGAVLHVEALLGGKIARTSQDSMFQLDGDAFSGVHPGGLFRLEIPSGFIRQDTDVQVSYSEEELEFGLNRDIFQNPDGPFGDFTEGDSQFIKIDYARGYILLEANRYNNRYVRVQCDTGFEPGTTPLPTTGLPAYDAGTTYAAGDQVAYNSLSWTATVSTTGVAPGTNANWARAYIPMENIPPNLYEAIMTMVPTVFDSSQTTNRSQQAQPQYEKAADHARLLLRDYLRIKGFAFRPIW